MSNAPESQAASQEAPPKKRRLSTDDLVASLADNLSADTSSAPREEVSTPEAATRTDNNDRDPLGEKLEEANKGKKRKSDDEEVEESSADPDEDSEEETDEAEDVEEDVEDEEDSEEDDDTDDVVDPEDEIVFTTPDGEDVSLRELKRGFLREADYTRKTQALAEERSKVETAIERIGEHNNLVAEQLNLALSIVEPQLAELAQTQWDQLAQQDPYTYAEKRALFDQAQARYNSLRQAAQRTVQVETARKQDAFQRRLQAEQEKLKMALPELADPKTGRKLAHAIKEYALSSGLSEKEASNLTDHRLVVMLNKARMYDELSKSGLTAAKKKISKAPKKSVRAGQPPSKQEISRSKRDAQRAKLKKSGRMEDLVDMLLG